MGVVDSEGGGNDTSVCKLLVGRTLARHVVETHIAPSQKIPIRAYFRFLSMWSFKIEGSGNSKMIMSKTKSNTAMVKLNIG